MTKAKDTIQAGYVRRAGAAKYLNISLRTLADLQAKRIIPFSKLGQRTVLFKLSDLDTVVARYKVATAW